MKYFTSTKLLRFFVVCFKAKVFKNSSANVGFPNISLREIILVVDANITLAFIRRLQEILAHLLNNKKIFVLILLLLEGLTFH